MTWVSIPILTIGAQSLVGIGTSWVSIPMLTVGAQSLVGIGTLTHDIVQKTAFLVRCCRGRDASLF